MKYTEKLNLPIYDTPETDLFKIQEWNEANQSLDEAYKEITTFREEIPKVNANAEIVEARGNEITLGANIRRIDSQLEQSNQNIFYKGLVQNRWRKPIISFVDDDGSSSVYIKLKPLSEELNLKIACALPTAKIGLDTVLTLEQVKELKKTGRFEFVSHTKNHINLTTVDEETQIMEMRESQEWLKSQGLDYDILVYPNGGVNETIRKNAKKFFKMAIDIDDSKHKVNYPPLTTYNLERVYTRYGFDVCKNAIDEAIKNNGWVIFGMHCWESEWDADIIKQVVAYARSLNVEIVGLTEGLNKFGNILEIGDSSNIYGANTQVIDCDGISHGSSGTQVEYRVMSSEWEVNNSTPPSYFPIGKTTITQIPSTNTAGLPTGRGGILKTNVYSTLTSYPYTTQEWYPINDSASFLLNNLRYIRYWNRQTLKWSEWKELTDSYYYRVYNTITSNTLIADFPAYSTTLTTVDNSGATGFPDNSAGTVITHSVGKGYGYQIYKKYNTNKTYIRHSKSDGSWDNWIDNTPYNIIESQNAYTNDNLITDYPLGKITTCTISSTNATGFPNNSAGILTTYRLADAYGRQEYRLYRSNSMYSRYIEATGNWSAWEKISII